MIPTTSRRPSSACFTASVIALVVLAYMVVISPAQADAFAEAVALHNAARDGDESSLKPALERFERLGEEQPDNAEVIAYLGSVYAISAREGFNVISKMRNTNRALRELDRALELAPDNFTVRMVRANVHRNLPRMFGRGDDAVTDMIALHDIFLSAGDPTARMAESMASIYEALMERAPEKGDWTTARANALKIADEESSQ